MSALAYGGEHSVRRLFTDDARPLAAELRDVDVLFIHRYCDPRAQQLVIDAKAAGAAVVWDNDDDMGAMPRSSVTYKHFGGIAWERRLAQMQRIFRNTDLATAPSAVLAARLREWGAPRTATIENFLLPGSLTTDARPHAGVTIGWVAGLEHAMDVGELAIDATLKRLLDEHPEVNVVSLGLRLPLRSERYRHKSGVPLTELTQHIAEFDIAIAPIADVDFNRSRSNIKVKEYAAAGVPWLASPIGPYAALGEKQGGRLVADDGWYTALKQLVEKPRERRKLAKRGRQWAKSQELLEQSHVWVEHFEQAIAHARAAA